MEPVPIESGTGFTNYAIPGSPPTLSSVTYSIASISIHMYCPQRGKVVNIKRWKYKIIVPYDADSDLSQ